MQFDQKVDILYKVTIDERFFASDSLVLAIIGIKYSARFKLTRGIHYTSSMFAFNE